MRMSMRSRVHAHALARARTREGDANTHGSIHTHRAEVDDVDGCAHCTEGDEGSPHSNRSGGVRVALPPGEMAGVLRILHYHNSARPTPVPPAEHRAIPGEQLIVDFILTVRWQNW